MSLWKKLFGISKKETEIIEEPEHELAKMAPDDLMVLEKKDESNNLDKHKEDLSNKDSP